MPEPRLALPSFGAEVGYIGRIRIGDKPEPRPYCDGDGREWPNIDLDGAASDAAASFEAAERLMTGIGARLRRGSRLTGLERRMASVEKSVDGIARSNHRIEQMLTDSAARLP